MDTRLAYDPEIQPNAEAWLELEEQEGRVNHDTHALARRV